MEPIDNPLEEILQVKQERQTEEFEYVGKYNDCALALINRLE